ncbi:MAG: 2-methylcitrate dehydratase, partial [Alphaproteobacteria bacterium]|nr:2-methylcitrate dehydratase [Alphaproteobacteria bacterium]
MAKAKTPQGPGAIEQLATWALAPKSQDIPPAAINQAKILVLDTIGCGFAAFDEEAAEAVLETLKEMGGAPQCTVLGSATKTSAPNAVLVNGSLIRILDLNDYVNTKSGQIGGHPSDNIPVALAGGELGGSAGLDVLAATVLGYEIYGRLKELMDRNSNWDGVTVSGFVAPAMAGRLLGLDHGKLAHALALSGARAITPIAVRQGDISAAKSVANALVAQNGMQATILAKHGLTGPLDLFENQHGIKSVFPGINWMEAITAPLAADSYIMSCHIKAYPCLATGQGIVAAGLDIHRQVNGDVERLKHIKVAIADTPSLQRQKDDPGRVDPRSREAADHSFNFLAAVSILDGKFSLAQFDNDRWNDSKVRGVMERLEIVCDASLNPRSPGGFPCAMRATANDGREYLAEILDPPGFSRKGIDAKAVIDKFNSITAGRLGPASRQRIIDAAMAFDASTSCA